MAFSTRTSARQRQAQGLRAAGLKAELIAATSAHAKATAVLRRSVQVQGRAKDLIYGANGAVVKVLDILYSGDDDALDEAKAERDALLVDLAAATAAVDRATHSVDNVEDRQGAVERALADCCNPATTTLIDAASTGDVDRVMAALDAGADPNWPTPARPISDEVGRSALMRASSAGHVAVVRALLRAGADPNLARTDTGSTALLCAAYSGHTDVLSALMDNHADHYKSKTDDGTTALVLAAQEGHLAATSLLLDRGAEPNQATTDNGDTPLMGAAFKGHTEVVKQLLRRGADPNQSRTTHGDTALMLAAQEGHVEVTIRLLVWGADPNKITPADGVSAAMLACQQGHLTLAQVLATFGANLAASTTDADHDTPRKLADQNGQLAMVSWLDAVDGWEPFRIAMGCRFGDAARAALKIGMIDPAGCTPSHLVDAASALEDALWPGSLPICPATLTLAREARRGWASSRHFLFHSGVRHHVRVVLTMAFRLARATSMRRSIRRGSGVPPLPVLPAELWLLICKFFCRCHWAAPPLALPA